MNKATRYILTTQNVQLKGETLRFSGDKFCFSNNQYSFTIVPVVGSNEYVRIRLDVNSLTIDSVYIKVSDGLDSVELGGITTSETDKSTFWKIQNCRNAISDAVITYNIISALSTKAKIYYLTAQKDTSAPLTIKETNDFESNSGAFWELNETPADITTKGTIIKLYESPSDSVQNVLIGDGTNLKLGSINELINSGYYWKQIFLKAVEMENAFVLLLCDPDGNGISYLGLSPNEFNYFYLPYFPIDPNTFNPSSDPNSNIKEVEIILCYDSNNDIYHRTLFLNMGYAGALFLNKGDKSGSLKVVPEGQSPKNNTEWSIINANPPIRKKGLKAVATTDAVVIDIDSLQPLTWITKTHSFLMGDKNQLTIINEPDNVSGFTKVVLNPVAGTFLHGWCVFADTLYLANNCCIEAYDLNTIKQSLKNLIPIAKSDTLGKNGDSFSPPVYDYNNDCVFILRNDGNVYGINKKLENQTPMVYNHEDGDNPQHPLAIFVESTSGKAALYYYNTQGKKVLLRVNFSSQTINFDKFETVANRPFEIAVANYKKRTASTLQKTANNWSAIPLDQSKEELIVYAGSNYILFTQNNKVINSTSITLLTGETFPKFNFENNQITPYSPSDDNIFAYYILQNVHGENVIAFGSPLITLDTELNKYILYASCIDPAKGNLTFKKFEVDLPKLHNIKWAENWADLDGKITNIFKVQEEYLMNLQFNQTRVTSKLIADYQAAPIKKSNYNQQSDLLANISPIIDYKRSLMEIWCQFNCITNA